MNQLRPACAGTSVTVCSDVRSRTPELNFGDSTFASGEDSAE